MRDEVWGVLALGVFFDDLTKSGGEELKKCLISERKKVMKETCQWLCRAGRGHMHQGKF